MSWLSRAGKRSSRVSGFRERNMKNILSKKNIVIFLVISLGLFLIFLPGYSKRQELAAKNERLQRRIKELEEENRRFLVEEERLRTDPAYVEKIARDDMGMARKGEIIIKEISTQPVRH